MRVTLRNRRGWLFLDIYNGGGRKRLSLHTKDPVVAEDVRKKIEAELVLGRFDISRYEQRTIVTIEEFFKQYFQFAETFKKPAVISNERRIADRFTAFVGASKSLLQITPQVLDQWQASILSQEYSPAYFNIMRRFLHAALNTAVRWNYAETNPIRHLKKMRVEEHRIYLTMTEFQKILRKLDDDIQDPNKAWRRRFNVKFRLFLEFLFLTGMRRQEALSLTPERIDIENSVLYLEKTKGKKFRAIPMHNKVKEIFCELDQKLFADIHPTTASHKFRALAIRAGLSETFKLHSLRHSFATNLVSKGVDISVVQSLLGHADIRTTLIYSKTTLDAMRSNINKLDWPE